MNDFTDIRAARPDVPPPTDAVIAAARAAMWEAEARSGADRRLPRQRRFVRLPIVVVALAAIAVALVIAVRSIGPDRDVQPVTPPQLRFETAPETITGSDRLRIEDGDILRGGRTVAADAGGGEELIDPLTGALVPIAVSDPARPGTVVVTSWQQLASQNDQQVDGTPEGRLSLRLVDTTTGTSSLMVRGAHSAAIARDGRIAFAKGVDDVVRTNRRFLAHVVVRAGPQGEDVTWTARPGLYLPVMWAGNTLIAYQQSEGEQLDVVAFDGPRKQRTLVREGSVVALSPTGDRAFVTSADGAVSIIDVSSGSTVASVSLTPGAGATGTGADTQAPVIFSNGDWQGERIVANSTRGLAVFTTRGTPQLERVIALPGRPHGIDQPRVWDANRIVGSADLSDTDFRNAVVICTLSTATCATGTPGATPRDWRRWIDNQSR